MRYVVGMAAGTTVLATTCAVQEDPSGILGICAPGIIDCVDVVVEDDGAAGSACPVENPDCGDNPAVEE